MKAKARKESPRTGSEYILYRSVSSGVVGWNAGVLGYSNLVIDPRKKNETCSSGAALYADLDRQVSV